MTTSDTFAVLQVLGDRTRFTMYRELVDSPSPLTTTDLADRMDLHPNTIRPHLERMREVGLLVVDTPSTGHVGRPQHRYSVSASAPQLGLEPGGMRELLSAVVRVARAADASPDDAITAGRSEGHERAVRRADAPSSLEALVGDLASLGFDPVVTEGVDADEAVIAFSQCPFDDAVDQHGDLVCGLHRGMVEGFVDELADSRVSEFCTSAHPTPCRVALTAS